ncbi:hypothetical protein TUBRATIS_27460 [Tubulinosema ratisbonensis]|uniref:Uncharacterized protein n=1 Tax=Tubulinosema ratisbonensis TaxID=291195 RepID=A0A437AID2_9MICR|nr:hypothetical protein TUBRATIS_27460 [Tubulinosema ratisbonensis]
MLFILFSIPNIKCLPLLGDIEMKDRLKNAAKAGFGDLARGFEDFGPSAGILNSLRKYPPRSPRERLGDAARAAIANIPGALESYGLNPLENDINARAAIQKAADDARKKLKKEADKLRKKFKPSSSSESSSDEKEKKKKKKDKKKPKEEDSETEEEKGNPEKNKTPGNKGNPEKDDKPKPSDDPRKDLQPHKKRQKSPEQKKKPSKGGLIPSRKKNCEKIDVSKLPKDQNGNPYLPPEENPCCDEESSDENDNEPSSTEDEKEDDYAIDEPPSLRNCIKFITDEGGKICCEEYSE